MNHAWLMTRPTFIDLNPLELNYYPFLISLDNFNWICDVVTTFLQKYVLPVKQKT